MFVLRWLKIVVLSSLTIQTLANEPGIAWIDKTELAAYQQDYDTLQSLLTQTEQPYAKAHIAYRLAITHLNLGEKKKADQALEVVMDTLPEFLKQNPEHIEAMAILASSIGLRVAVKPYRAPFIAGDSKDWIDQALVNDPNHPLPHMIKGISLYNSPALFGGDKTQALEHFQQAQRLFNSSEETFWGEPENLYWLGLNHDALKNGDDAKLYLGKALKQVPSFKQAQRALEKISERDSSL
jgi:tetratricopeptide (TPR) repeat protein